MHPKLYLYSYTNDPARSQLSYKSAANTPVQQIKQFIPPHNGSFYDPQIFSLAALILAILLVTVQWLVLRANMPAA